MSRISRTKRKKLMTIGLTILVIGLAFGIAFFVSIRQIKSDYNVKLATYENTINQNQRTIYRALEDIPAGTAISDKNTEIVTVFSDQNTSVYMTEEDFGKIAVADIAAGQNICANMIGNELQFSLRECEYALLTLNNNLQQYDLIDVRIMYPNGENYVVLTKKCIQTLDLANNNILLWLEEDEIQDMSSAIVDIFLHDGAILYTTKYIEDGQEPLKRNYQPSNDVMIAIANDPNIVDEALAELTARMNANLRAEVDRRLSIFEDDNNISPGQVQGSDLSESIKIGDISEDTPPIGENTTPEGTTPENGTPQGTDPSSGYYNPTENDNGVDVNDDTVKNEGDMIWQ